MRILLFLPACLVLGACKEKAPPTAFPKPDAGVTAPIVKPAAQATPEQISSVVRVRVLMGALMRNYTGAIVHRDELKETGSFFEQQRCVLALLDGWSEEQLRSSECRIVVFRNIPGTEVDFALRSFPGRLLGFDPQTKIASIAYFQGFSAGAEVGFRIERESGNTDSGVALRLVSGLEYQSRGMPATQRPPLLTPESATWAAGPGGEGILDFPKSEPGGITDELPLVINAPTILKGFAMPAGEGKVRVVRAAGVRVAIEMPRVQVSGVSFEGGRDSARISFQVEPVGSSPMPRSVVLKTEKVTTGRKDVAALQEPFAPVASANDRIHLTNGAASRAVLELSPPENEGDERTYLVQLGWKSYEEEKQPSIHSRPFIVRLARKGGVIVPTTEGVPNLSEARPNKDDQTTTLALESKVVSLFEIAAGREVLVQLEAAPYWKRYSLQKSAWLPLPDVTLANCDLAGNLSHLFVLDRAIMQLRKYRLTDLAETGSTNVKLVGDKMVIRAGCATDRAPVHLLSNRAVASFDAVTLEQKDLPNIAREAHWTGTWRATGDGLTLIAAHNDHSGSIARYMGDLVGLQRGALMTSPSQSSPTVSASYVVEDSGVKSNANTVDVWSDIPNPAGPAERYALPNAPLYLRARPGDMQKIPAVAPRIQCIGFSDGEPLAEFDAPELASVMQLNQRQQPFSRHPFCVDPLSRRVLVLAPDQKTLIVRNLTYQADRRQPVMLNWPDTSFTRGDDFRFRPVIFGEGQVSAELLGPKEPTEVKVDEQGISFRIAPNELATLLMLNIKISGPRDPVHYAVPLHVTGAPQAYAMPAATPPDAVNQFGSFGTLQQGKGERKALTSKFHFSPSPVMELLGPVNGHAVLVRDDRRLEFLSLESMKVSNGVAISEKVKYFAGCEALFEFDLARGTLSRISVPDGLRGPSLTVAASSRLHGIAFGSKADDPLTLFMENTRQPQDGNAGQTYLTTQVLNSETLAPRSWAVPQLWENTPIADADRKLGNPLGQAFSGIRPSEGQFPRQIVGARNGSLLVLPRYLLLQSPKYSILAPYLLAPGGFPTAVYSNTSRASGSITGVVVSNTDGKVIRNGAEMRDVYQRTIVTPCGRYEIRETATDNKSGPTVEIRVLENAQPLFRLQRLAARACDMDSLNHSTLTAQLLRDGGPLVLFSPGRRVLQFIELNIPQLAREILPTSFHVISQPMPFVMDGTLYEYQVEVNNPALVAGYKLREKTDNVTVSPTGKIQVRPPATVLTPMQIHVSLEIAGTSGQVVLHEFPLLVLPRKVPAPTSRVRAGGSGIPRSPGLQ